MNTQVVGGVRPQTGPAREHIKHKYLEALMLIERLHRRLLDVIKDDFERTGEPEVRDGARDERIAFAPEPKAVVGGHPVEDLQTEVQEEQLVQPLLARIHPGGCRCKGGAR